MGNIFGSSEFATAGSTLAQAVLGSQPNAQQSAAYAAAAGAQNYARGLAKQQALKKARKKREKAKKSKLFGSIGSTLGAIGGSLIPIPGVGTAVGAALGAGLGGTVGGMAGEALGGGEANLGSSVAEYGAPAAAMSLGQHLVDTSSVKTPAGTLNKPKRRRIGKALLGASGYDGLDDDELGGRLVSNSDGTFTYLPAKDYSYL